MGQNHGNATSKADFHIQDYYAPASRRDAINSASRLTRHGFGTADTLSERIYVET
jgi:hypothetical protein